MVEPVVRMPMKQKHDPELFHLKKNYRSVKCRHTAFLLKCSRGHSPDTVMQALIQLRNVTACRLKTSLQSAARHLHHSGNLRSASFGYKTHSWGKHSSGMFPADTETPTEDPELCYYFLTLTTSQTWGHHRDHKSNSKCEAVRLKCDDMKVEKGSYSSSEKSLKSSKSCRYIKKVRKQS